jgi:serine/threonine protein kinase
MFGESVELPHMADLYSVGAVLYTLLCGYSPFQANDLKTSMELNRKGEVRFDADGWRDIGYHAIDLVEKLMSYSPNNRPSPADALQHAFFCRPEMAASDNTSENVVVVSCGCSNAKKSVTTSRIGATKKVKPVVPTESDILMPRVFNILAEI